METNKINPLNQNLEPQSDDVNNIPNQQNSMTNKESVKLKDENVKYLRIKELFVQWSLFSHFHCYPKIFQTKNNLLRIAWLALFLMFTCVMI